MVNPSMSRSVAPLFVTIGLALVVSAPPLAAQRAETVVRTAPRAAPGDSVAPRLRRLERSIDSLLRRFHGDDLSADQRARLSQLIDERVAEFTALRMAVSPPRERNVFLRVPEWRVEPQSGAEPFFPRFEPASMVPGWIGIVVSGAPTQIRVENNEMFMRYLAYPEIWSVDPRSPAQRAGVSPGDTLMAYNGRDVRREEISITKLLQPKATVTVRVRRDGKVREMPVVVADAPARIKIRRDQEMHDADAGWVPLPSRPMIAQTAPSAPPARSFFPPAPGRTVGAAYPVAPRPPVLALPPTGLLGAQFATVSESMKRNLDLPAGVLVTMVPIGSPADESGLQEGDVIIRVNDQPVKQVHELRDHVARSFGEGSRSLSVELRRGKERRSLNLRW
jgi:membrane-associated protease RseP (regulator of RpoE activity)